MKQIKQLTTELTFRCNAKCPACHRWKPLRINLNEAKYTISLERFQQLFNPDLLDNLQWLVLNGNFGDSIMNKQFREIISYVKSRGTRLLIHTNGGIHNKDYWNDVGNILTKDDIINFDLDGLQDTHHIYRINTKFDKVLSNAKAVIDSSNAQVHWKYIVFEHNKHQIEEARKIAKQTGFTTFSTVKTSRDVFAPKSGQFIHSKKTREYQEAERKIHCVWGDWGKWYVSPNGLVFRCCWTGGHYFDKQNDRFYYPPEFERLFNGFEVPIQKIISYNYWNKLQQFLQGYDRSFKLCKSQCGKIVSSIEKTEENLKTGTKEKIDASNQWGN
jgi:MoaA/NifB/PqqE/SkfB family radical SAM enzyme|tara:strand:- start:228 stop:1214 length:987 start_codon:yes stop_codon:yes gene_type:complete